VQRKCLRIEEDGRALASQSRREPSTGLGRPDTNQDVADGADRAELTRVVLLRPSGAVEARLQMEPPLPDVLSYGGAEWRRANRLPAGGWVYERVKTALRAKRTSAHGKLT
jgi:hypothetical protein